MKVQRAIIPNANFTTWFVLDDNYLPVQPIQQFLRYFNNIERAPNTIKSYAYHLKLYWEFIKSNNLDWTIISLSEIAEFIRWLRDPQPIGVAAIHQRAAKRTETTINVILTAAAMFYDYHERLGTIPNSPPFYKQSLQVNKRYKKFLHGIGKIKPGKNLILKLKAAKRPSQILNANQVGQLLDACNCLRDKLLISMLYETGMRIGQALALRHEDIHSRECIINIAARDDNTNRVYAKTKTAYPIHVSPNLIRLYANYLVDEVKDNITDYVFINLWRTPLGKPMTVSAIEDLFRRLSKKTGIKIHPHLLRHTHATELIRNGWDPSYVQLRLGHSSIQTTINTYVHLSEDDLKKAFQEYQTKKENKHE